MTIRIEPREGVSFDAMTRRFNRQMQYVYGRRWCKHRYGYYEKPRELRRKKRKMHTLNQNSKNLNLHIDQKELYARTGPTLAAGK